LETGTKCPWCHLGLATALFREMEMRFWLEPAEAEISELASGRWHHHAAAGVPNDRTLRRLPPRAARDLGESLDVLALRPQRHRSTLPEVPAAAGAGVPGFRARDRGPSD